MNLATQDQLIDAALTEIAYEEKRSGKAQGTVSGVRAMLEWKNLRAPSGTSDLIDALRAAGFKVQQVPAGRAVRHVVTL